MTAALHRMQDERLAGALAVSITVVALAWASFGSDGDEGGAGAYALTSASRHSSPPCCSGASCLTPPTPGAGWILGALALGLALG